MNHKFIPKGSDSLPDDPRQGSKSFGAYDEWQERPITTSAGDTGGKRLDSRVQQGQKMQGQGQGQQMPGLCARKNEQPTTIGVHHFHGEGDEGGKHHQLEPPAQSVSCHAPTTLGCDVAAFTSSAHGGTETGGAPLKGATLEGCESQSHAAAPAPAQPSAQAVANAEQSQDAINKMSSVNKSPGEPAPAPALSQAQAQPQAQSGATAGTGAGAGAGAGTTSGSSTGYEPQRSASGTAAGRSSAEGGHGRKSSLSDKFAGTFDKLVAKAGHHPGNKAEHEKSA